jgi:serine/threonine protein kinase
MSGDLSAFLLKAGLVRVEEIGDLRKAQKRLGVRLGEHLVESGRIAESALVAAFAKHLRLDPVDLDAMQLSTEVVSLIPAGLCRAYRVLPVQFDVVGSSPRLVLAVTDPLNPAIPMMVAEQVGAEVKLELRIAGERAMSRHLERMWNRVASTEDPKPEPKINPELETQEAAPTVVSAAPELKTTKESPFDIQSRIGRDGAAEISRIRVDDAGEDGPYQLLYRLADAASTDATSRSRFLGDMPALIGGKHPGIIHVFATSSEPKNTWIRSEWFESMTLKDLIEKARLQGRTVPTNVAVYIAMEVLKALDFSHEIFVPDAPSKGIIHKCLSPRRILLSREGLVKITGFGMATRPEDMASFHAPEQESEGSADRRTDVFLVGLMLFEMLSGVGAMSPGVNLAALNERVWVRRLARALRKGRPHRSGPLEVALFRALSLQPRRRFSTAGEFCDAISRELTVSITGASQSVLAPFIRDVDSSGGSSVMDWQEGRRTAVFGAEAEKSVRRMLRVDSVIGAIRPGFSGRIGEMFSRWRVGVILLVVGLCFGYFLLGKSNSKDAATTPPSVVEIDPVVLTVNRPKKTRSRLPDKFEIIPDAVDERAPEGHAFAAEWGVHVYERRGEGRELARLKLGELVRVVSREGQFSRVEVPSLDQAGWVSSASLRRRTPVRHLALRLEFASCAGASKDACLFEAKQKRDDCEDVCRGLWNASGVESRVYKRCFAVCRVAFDECAATCGELPSQASQPQRPVGGKKAGEKPADSGSGPPR